MTEQEINVAIAEACGIDTDLRLRICRCGDSIESHTMGRNEHNFFPMDDTPIPSYTTDLNAMHDAENMMDEGTLERYRQQLRHYPSDSSNYWMAPAEHRAEAYVRAIGKWK